MNRTADRARTVLRGVGQTLITFGVVILLFTVYELKVTNLVTGREQGRLTEALAARWAEPQALQPGGAGEPVTSVEPVELGAGIAVLRIPRLGDWNDKPPVVVEGVGTADLKKGPGHIPGTAMPGDIGNTVISGHRTTYGAPFERLDELRPGDAVVVETRDTWLTYTVSGSKIVKPTAIEVTYPVPGDATATPTKALLTLTTCNPKYSARERLIIFAELSETKQKVDGEPAALAPLAAGQGG